jgi:hypothetical protein
LAVPSTAPTNFPRTDLINVFLKGIQGVNQPAASVGRKWRDAEMLRLNTSTPITAQAKPTGVAAGDNAGFNGRRPGDDVVDCLQWRWVLVRADGTNDTFVGLQAR